jgi:hypothetical protein
MGEVEKSELTYRVVVRDTAPKVTQGDIQHQADRELEIAGSKVTIARYAVDNRTYYEAIGEECQFSPIALVKIWYHYEPL